MILRVPALSAACLICLAALPAHAQGLKPAVRAPITTGSTASTAVGTVSQADYIVVVVNSEPITNHDVAVELQRVQQQYVQQRQAMPEARELRRRVLERLINEKAQLQLAHENGIKVDEPSIDQAEQSVALQNQLSVAELRRRIVQDGITPKQFRDQLRDQLLLTRLREREVEPRVKVSDLEVEQYLQDQLANSNVPASQLVNIAQLLVAVPENASDAQKTALQAKAQRALERARAGEDFTALAKELSDSAAGANGGQLGLRPAERYPALFLDAVRSLPVGGVSELVRSGAGFHVLKLVERRNAGLPPMVVTQSHARHILLRPGTQLSEAGARDKLNDFRRRIQSGQTDFATLAREHSQDGSAEQGGDLGWAYPGQFVPEFEAVMNRLAPGQISEPLISRFGVHLIQLLERRNTALGEREQREMVRNMLREKKLDEAYANWARDVRARAYVEVREPQQ
jgi:peptidyl-prolyl cis-trans isomerase SurA